MQKQGNQLVTKVVDFTQQHSLAIFLLVVFFLTLKPLYDNDFWFHLRIGQFIWENRTIPHTDILSFTLPNYPYVYHSWLSEVIHYLIYQTAGFWGINLLYSSITTLGVYFIYRTISLITSPYRALVSSIVFLPLLIVIADLRIHAISFLGLTIVVYLLYQHHQHSGGYAETYWQWLKQSRLLTLVGLFLVWVNLHGGFIIGIGILGLYTVLSLLSRKHSPKHKLYLSLTALIILLVTLINPFSFRAYQLPITMTTNPIAREYNSDWHPLFSRTMIQLEPNYVIVQIYACLSMLIVAFVSRDRLNPFTIISGLLFIALFISKRYLLPFSILIIPLVTIRVDRAFPQAIMNRIAPYTRTIKLYSCLWAGVLLAIVSLNLVRVIYVNSDPTNYGSYSSLITFPSQAIHYMQNNSYPQNLFNNYDWGGYLTWHLPDQQVFIDGRMDNFIVHGESFLVTYHALLNAGTGYETLLEQYQIRSVLLKPSDPLVNQLLATPDWQTRYQDAVSIFMTKSLPDD